MRVRSVVAAALVLAVASLPARARAQATDPLADHLVPGDYLRVGVSSVVPVNPQGSLNDWNRGVGLGLEYENWDVGRNGVGKVGYGFMLDYSLLPFDSDHFKSDFTPLSGNTLTATASKAGILQVGVKLRIRIPAPFIMPSIALSLGFLDWHPGEIKYTTTTSPTVEQTAKQQHRSGGLVSISGGLDKHIYDRFAIFGEAAYTYGYTSFGQGLAGSGTTCLRSSCDLLKNTPLGTIRGGLRVRVSK
jgi:hypothetical protein